MRIGLLAPPHTKEAGGGFTYVSMIFNAIETFDFGAEIVVLDFKAIDYFPEASLPDETTEAASSSPINLRFTRSLNHHLKLHKIDLLWLVTPSTTVLPCVPFVVTVWDLAHRFYPFFPEVSLLGWTWQQREDYFRTVLPRASFIFTGTKRGVAEIKTCYGIPEERMRVIPLPTPRSAPGGSENSAMPVEGRYLFYPAQFWAHKNHVRAIRALRLLHEEASYRDLKLVLVGSDQTNEPYVRKIVEDEGMAGSVVFLGFVDRPVLETLYRNAEALLYLSFLGPDNLPPLEALDFDCPVVVSDHPGHRDQLADAAIFVDPLDETAIADAIRALDPACRKRLAERGRAIVEARRVESYLAAVRDVFAEFSAYQACWPAPSSL